MPLVNNIGMIYMYMVGPTKASSSNLYLEGSYLIRSYEATLQDRSLSPVPVHVQLYACVFNTENIKRQGLANKEA
jgi:hypothetical protein